MKLLLTALLALAPVAQQEAGLPELEKRITLDHRGKFREFISRLRADLGVNIIVDPRAKESADLEAEKELVLKDVKGSSALRWVASLYGLEHAIQGGVVAIGPAKWLHAPETRSYDVRPLRVRSRDHVGPVVNIPKEVGVSGFTVTLHEVKENIAGEDRLVDLVKESVAPGTWEGGAVVEMTPDHRLVVTHVPSVHRELARFLELLGSLLVPMVTVTAEIVEADAASAALLDPGAPLLIAPAEIDKVVEQLKAGRREPGARTLQTTGAVTQRVHAILVDESSYVMDYEGKDPIIGTSPHDIAVLDCRPILVVDGRFISLETRLTLGQAGESGGALKTKVGEITYREGTLTRLASTFLVPNGGGVVFGLPARGASAKKGQLCLLRAASNPPPDVSPAVQPSAEDGPQNALTERLSKAPPVTVDLEEVAFDEFLKWFRNASGLNVVADDEARTRMVTLHGKNLAMANVLRIVLQPHGLEFVLRDEAIHIVGKDKGRKANRLELFDVRDITFGLHDFPRPGESDPRQQFTGEDLANLIKNTIEKDQWEEADGKALQFHEGVLVVRNTPDVIRKCAQFVREMRRSRLRIVALRADTLLIPAQAADPILGRAGADSYLIDEKQYEALARAGTFQERLGWHSFETQRTSLCWDREVGYLRDWDLPADPISDNYHTQSFLDVRPMPGRDGRSVTLELEFEDRRLVELGSRLIEDMIIQTPLSSRVQTRTSLRIPEDRMALFKWSAPARGAERQYRLLILKPRVWQEAK